MVDTLTKADRGNARKCGARFAHGNGALSGAVHMRARIHQDRQGAQVKAL